MTFDNEADNRLHSNPSAGGGSEWLAYFSAPRVRMKDRLHNIIIIISASKNIVRTYLMRFPAHAWADLVGESGAVLRVSHPGQFLRKLHLQPLLEPWKSVVSK
jgi:hypothetical protein